MKKEYKTYIQFLAAEYNVLYLGDEIHELYTQIEPYFNTTLKMDLNESVFPKLSSFLNKQQINIVIINAKEKPSLADKFFQQVKAYDDEILTLLLFDPKEYEKLAQTIALVDTIVCYPIMQELFYKRLFSILSTPYAIKSIGRREIVLKQQTNVSQDSIEKFFDTYEGSSLFIADELAEMVTQLNSGELSKELFEQIAQKIDEVADIFAQSQETKAVTPVYHELAAYLRNLQLGSIQPEQLKAFTYLAEILSDVSVYLLDMFVDRIFKDVYIFEHSLQNNIIFMKNSLEGKEDEDESELDFF